MADQILSQEEIDALISAMDSGEVDLKTETTEKGEAVSYDLTSPHNKVLGGHFEGLELIYDELTKMFRTSLSSFLGKTLEVKLASAEMLKFGVFLQSFSNPTGFSVFTMEPLIGSALMAVEPGLAFSLIDCMFGGTGKPVAKIREFTLIEQGVIRKVSAEMLKLIERAWGVLFPVEVMLKKMETKPQFVHIVSPDDVVINMVFTLSAEEFNGSIYICVPYLMLEPVKEKLSFKSLAEMEQRSKLNDQLVSLLQETQVALTVELGKTIHTVGEVLNLQVGDIIKLSNGAHDPVIITVENIPKYEGFPGISKGNRAVEVTAVVRDAGGKAEYGYIS